MAPGCQQPTRRTKKLHGRAELNQPREHSVVLLDGETEHGSRTSVAHTIYGPIRKGPLHPLLLRANESQYRGPYNGSSGPAVECFVPATSKIFERLHLVFGVKYSPAQRLPFQKPPRKATLFGAEIRVDGSCSLFKLARTQFRKSHSFLPVKCRAPSRGIAYAPKF